MEKRNHRLVGALEVAHKLPDDNVEGGLNVNIGTTGAPPQHASALKEGEGGLHCKVTATAANSAALGREHELGEGRDPLPASRAPEMFSHRVRNIYVPGIGTNTRRAASFEKVNQDGALMLHRLADRESNFAG